MVRLRKSKVLERIWVFKRHLVAAGTEVLVRISFPALGEVFAVYMVASTSSSREILEPFRKARNRLDVTQQRDHLLSEFGSFEFICKYSFQIIPPIQAFI